MQLTDRLMKVAGLVERANILCDIGCDHGYLPIYLVENDIVDFSYACDVKQGPVDIAKRNINNSGLASKIEVVKSDGLIAVSNIDIDVITICGMGGRLIAKIISDSIDTAHSAKKLILQPMSEMHYLRKFLSENGFYIDNELLSKEYGRYYNIISAETGLETNTKEFDFYIGKKLIENNDSHLIGYLKKRLLIYKQNLPLKTNHDDIIILKELIFDIEKILN